MLKILGVSSLDEVISKSLPAHIRLNSKENELFDRTLKGAISEQAALDYIEAIANKNEVFTNYLGQGYHPTFVPPVILRNITENPAWYTSYTPYQAEISQGRLESLLNFQTLITELTGLPFANASLLDEATAAAEAMYLAFNSCNGKKSTFFIAENTFPYIKEVVKTRAKFIGVKVRIIIYNERLLKGMLAI